LKIAILYICTGKYSIFWQQFYESAEKYFLPSHEKQYFVFSDTLDNPHKENVSLIYQEKMGWPYDTLMRFHLFASIQGRLNNFDFIFFCNANLCFKKTITEEILSENGLPFDLIVVRHPFFYWVKDPKDFPYERRKKSLAYVSKGSGHTYVMGGFNGGKSEEYMEMVATLKNRITTDKKNGIIALWHDESHLNRYINESKKRIKILDYTYGFPEGHDLPLKNDVYITFLDKEKFGGHDFLRGQENSIPSIPVQKSFYPIRWLKQKIRSLL